MILIDNNESFYNWTTLISIEIHLEAYSTNQADFYLLFKPKNRIITFIDSYHSLVCVKHFEVWNIISNSGWCCTTK